MTALLLIIDSIDKILAALMLCACVAVHAMIALHEKTLQLQVFQSKLLQVKSVLLACS